MPEDACPCGSLAPFQACHGLLEAEYYRPRRPEWLRYRPPSTWTREMVHGIGRRYGDMGLYEVRVRDDRTHLLRRQVIALRTGSVRQEPSNKVSVCTLQRPHSTRSREGCYW